MTYTHAQFRADIQSVKDASMNPDPAVVTAAASLAHTLLNAAGNYGSIVTDGARSELRRHLTACQSQLVSLAATPQPIPEDPEEPAPSPAPPPAPPPVDGDQPPQG